jgi:single-strand DNA-binding protein
LLKAVAIGGAAGQQEPAMTIPTQMSLAGFIASTPQLNFTGSGVARFYARVGVEHARKEPDGSFTQFDPTFHDLVLYRTSAERAYARFRNGDSFVAHGYIHEYEMEKNGQSVACEEFVARRIGHDVVRTRYEVERKQAERSNPAPEIPQPAVGL